MKAPCETPDLAVRIAVCPTGCYHLKLGPLVVTLSRDSARTLAGALADALDAGAQLARPLN